MKSVNTKKKILSVFFLILIFSCCSVYPQKHSPSEFELHPEKFSFDNIYQNNNAEDSNLTLISHFAFGSCRAVAVVGNLLYAGNGGLLQIFDISDPSNLLLLSQLLLPQTNIYDIEVQGDYLFVFNKFAVINISDPYNPYIVPSDITVAALELEVEGDYAYVGGFGNIFILDISIPEETELISSISASGNDVESVALSGDYLYATTYNGFVIDIINVSDRHNPYYANSVYVGPIGGGLFVRENILYAGSNSNPRFKLFDITNPMQPAFVSGLQLDEVPYNITVIDSIAFLSLGEDGVGIINVGGNEPVLITYISSSYSYGYGNQSISDNLLIALSGACFDIYNISSITTPEYLTTYFTGDQVLKMDIKDDYLFCAAYSAGIRIIDISKPESLKIIGHYQIPGVFYSIKVIGNIAYCLADHSFIILDVSSPENLVKMSEISFDNELSNFYWDIQVSDSIAIIPYPASPYIQNYLAVINITDPSNPFVIDTFLTSGRAQDLRILSNYLYSAEESFGVQIYDLEQIPPQNIGSFSSHARSLEINNNTLFVASADLEIYDLEIPVNAQLISTLDLQLASYDMVKNGNHLIIAGYTVMKVIDVEDIHNPFVTAYTGDTFLDLFARSVATKGSIIYKGNWLRGIMVYDTDFLSNINEFTINEEISFQLFQSYPNPFNTNTIITYKIKNNSFIKINIYDLLGRKIETLENNWKEGGEHKVIFNSKDLASGVYFCSLQIDDEVITTIKLQLIK